MSVKWPHFSAEEIAAASSVLGSGNVNYWTGQQGRCFESEFAEKFGVPHAAAVSNGTVSLEMALRSLDVGPGDEVIVTPRSFLASVSSVVNVGATPVFADVCRDSQNITVETIEGKITNRTKAILPVHLAGWPCDMPGIVSLAESQGIPVIEDCAQAHGAAVDGQSVGSFGEIGSFSFCQDKIMTTAGEGGMLTSRSDACMEFIRAYRDHGKNLVKLRESVADPGFSYVHDSFGTNYRLTELQSAIGRIQLKKLDDWLTTRRANARRFLSAIEDIPGIRCPVPPATVEHAYYKLYVFVEPERLRSDWHRDRILRELTEQKVRCYTGSCPEIYMEAAFQSLPAAVPPSRLPIAKELGETSLMFLVDPTITDTVIDFEVDMLATVMRQAVQGV